MIIDNFRYKEIQKRWQCIPWLRETPLAGVSSSLCSPTLGENLREDPPEKVHC